MQTLQEVMTQFYSKIKVKKIEELRNKTILITGASGLIGTNLISFLGYLNKKHSLNIKIVGVIRSGAETWFEKGKNISYITLDLSKEKIDFNKKVDYIFHCATYAQPRKFLRLSKETILLNVNALFNLLDLAQKNNARFLYLSSAEIYGEADKKHIPTEESYFGNVNTLSERAIYAESKRIAETICFSYSKSISIKIARVLLTYGPGLKYDDQRVISEFIKRSQNEKKIVMMDSGKALRTFCFVGDLVEMLLNVMLSSKDIVYNLCGKDTYTIKEIAEHIGNINEAQVILPSEPESMTGTPKKSVLSNKKYIHEYKKKYFVKLSDGLKATSQWFKNIKK
jgi:dTDP-glucose 4,6-dehydratase/UDP-glucuronate decarboxylase